LATITREQNELAFNVHKDQAFIFQAEGLFVV